MATTFMEDSSTQIGQSVTIRGNISGDESLTVYGRIEGSIQLEETLHIAQSGIVKADIKVQHVIISGVVVGNVEASDTIELLEDARVVGDLQSPRIQITDGASFRGNIDMGDIANMPARPARRERPAEVPEETTAAKEKAAPTPATKKPLPPRAPSTKQAASSAKAKPSADQSKPKVKAKAKTKSKASTANAKKKGSSTKKPKFLDPPKARSLPKKKRSRVVVKRK